MTCRRGEIVLVLFPDSNVHRDRAVNVIVADNLATIRYSEIDRVIGSFPGMSEVDAALRATLAL